ncbi:hypothetical protein [Embleya sp. AB8]|uniref:hypothetical protein n=1 Tax=Embleya sp. AB8 TaxID=3156304 RepID=UPI003C75180A
MSAARLLPVPDRALSDLLDDAPSALRTSIYRALRKGRRTALADGLIAEVLAVRGPVEAARVLPACSPTVVVEYIGVLGHVDHVWTTFARRHPALALDEAERQLAGLPASDRDEWWTNHGVGVVAAGERFPHRVLDLIERHSLRRPLPWAFTTHIQRFLTADRSRVLRLLAASEQRGPTVSKLSAGVLRRLVGAGPESAELLALGRAVRTDERTTARLLKAMAPSLRVGFFDAVHADRNRSRDLPTGTLLAVLPHARRHAEARRMLALPSIVDDEPQRLRLLAYLPLTEAHDELAATTRLPNADDRATGYRRLITCAARTGDPAQFGTVVRTLTRLRNEQDPVRGAALLAVAQAHPRLFGADLVEVLTELVRDTLEARDTSHRTRAALTSLAERLLTHHVVGGAPELTGWALATFEQVAGRSGVIRLAGPADNLRHGREHEILAVLLPWIRAGVARGDHRPAFALATTLDRRAWALDALQEILHRATRDKADHVARTAITLWLADPHRRAERAAELVGWDESTPTVPVVLHALAYRRTDLLDAYLDGSALRGRFGTDGVRWIPYLPLDAMGRLLPRQQRAYAARLVELADDVRQHGDTRAQAVRRLARVPGFGRVVLHGYLDSSDVPLVEAALNGLTHTDDPGAALPILLAHVGDDRARVAAYSISRAARHIAPSVLEPALRQVLFGPSKVTSRKEAARVALREALPGAVALLAQAWSAPDQHRDVRGAIVSQLSTRLDDQTSWTVLRAAIDGPREAARTILALQPTALTPTLRARYAELVTTACASPDTEVRRAAYRAFPRWARYSPVGIAAIRDAVLDLGSQTGWREAAEALHTFTTNGVAPDTYLEVIESLIALDGAPDTPNADPDRDRPARRRLTTLLRQARTWADRDPAESASVLRPVRSALAAVPELRIEAAVLTASGLSLSGDTIEAELAALVELCAGRALPAIEAAGVLRDRLGRATATIDPDALSTAARLLAAQPAPAAGLFGCALVGVLGAQTGWPAEWRALLRDLRAHPDADVRETALAVRTTAA